MKRRMTEELPSSGIRNHTHVWQKLEEKGDEIILVCQHEGCAATKTVKKPKLKESKSGKKLLLG